jgi:hypothetical protein
MRDILRICKYIQTIYISIVYYTKKDRREKEEEEEEEEI